MMKRILIILLATVLLFAVVWGASLLWCEILTSQHGEEFAQAYEENTMIGPIESFKVLSCDGENARVYYVSQGMTLGSVLTFAMQEGKWQCTQWDTVWSSTGSASNVVWPYWHHCIYGGL